MGPVRLRVCCWKPKPERTRPSSAVRSRWRATAGQRHDGMGGSLFLDGLRGPISLRPRSVLPLLIGWATYWGNALLAAVRIGPQVPMGPPPVSGGGAMAS